MNRIFRAQILVQVLVVCLVGFLACTQSSQSKINIIKKDAPSPGAAAKVFGKTFSEEELEKANSEIFQARLRLWEVKKRQVEELAREKTFEALAKKENKSVDEFMKAQQEKAKKRIKNKDVEKFLTGRVQDPKKVSDRIRDQVKGILYLEKLVADYTKKNPIEFYLPRPRARKIDFDLENVADWGNKEALVTVVEYSDFQCPYCANAAQSVVKGLKKHYGKNKIRIVFKHFPLENIHPQAKIASVGSMCARKQKEAKFWTFHDKLFENQDSLGKDDLLSYAKKIGLNVDEFKKCLDDPAVVGLVERDIKEAAKIGVNSTPTFYVNSQPILGARSFEEFKEIIDEEIELAKK